MQRIFVKDYEFLYFAKGMGINISKNVSDKSSLKILDHAKQSAKDALEIFQKE